MADVQDAEVRSETSQAHICSALEETSSIELSGFNAPSVQSPKMSLDMLKRVFVVSYHKGRKLFVQV